MGRGGPAKILVVEDKEDHREIIVCALEGRGYQLLEAADVDSAVVVARQERPDLVFLDLLLPKEAREGLRLLELLKRERPEVRVVVYTCISTPEWQERAQAAGCDEFLVKPVELARVREVVARLLGAASETSHTPESQDGQRKPGDTPCGEDPKT